MSTVDDATAKADTFKSLGNKHMANKDYEDAYEAYSTAISISPLGPFSHIYLSNRAAALLSLRRYSAAAVDARRAITLAPTFGKAHARLGQSLYFLKDYAGAIAAYENAFQFEPENQVTWTYLNKAKKKFARQEQKKRQKENGTKFENVWDNDFKDERSVEETVDLANMALSVVTDGDTRGEAAGVLKPDDEHSNRHYDSSSAAFEKLQTTILNSSYELNEVDPDFDEALRLQEFAVINLHQKNYRKAAEEFSAALFLVPDDDNLTPQLYVGRAHALNGLQRHEGALNDAMMALSRNKDFADAHVALARSYFYLKNFEEAVNSFENAKACMEGDELSPLDKIYHDKANELMEVSSIDFDDHRSQAFSVSRKSMSKPVPKLKPPRFVSRQTLLNSSSNVPSLPKALQSQLPQSPTTLRVGPERKIMFLSEAMGVKLNRGPDGIVRVLSVSSPSENQKLRRQGEIFVGDIIREAAGVDLRRPLTNVMWSDTVALLKISPRPMLLIVAQEISEPPVTVRDELEKAQKELLQSSRPGNYHPKNAYKLHPPSLSGGLESVAETKKIMQVLSEQIETNAGSPEHGPQVENGEIETESLSVGEHLPSDDEDDVELSGHSNIPLKLDSAPLILFPNDALNSRNLAGYTAETWHEGDRHLRFHGSVSRYFEGRFFWSSHQYMPRTLALYENPDIILISRPPFNEAEVDEALKAQSTENSLSDSTTYEFAESIIFANTCKLQLSRLTTPTSVLPHTASSGDIDENISHQSLDQTSISSFEIIAPSERIVLSVLPNTSESGSQSRKEIHSITSRIEREVTQILINANVEVMGDIKTSDLSWMHSIVLGTLHSHVVSGHCDMLAESLIGKGSPSTPYEYIDDRDRNGFTALHYACFQRSPKAVDILLKAGADPTLPTLKGWKTPVHLSAESLDSISLSTLLSFASPVRADANALDGNLFTPMNIVLMKGVDKNGNRDPIAIAQCLKVLQKWGGELVSSQNDGNQASLHPVLELSCQWDHDLLDIGIEFAPYRFTLSKGPLKSIASIYQYPIHSCLLKVMDSVHDIDEKPMRPSEEDCIRIKRTLEILLCHGFEPNERIEFSLDLEHNLKPYVGYTPIQILAAIALILIEKESKLNKNEEFSKQFQILSEILVSSAEILSQNGARIWIDPPSCSRTGVDSIIEGILSNTGDPKNIMDPSLLNLEKNKDLILKLGGTERLASARALWLKEKSVEGSGDTMLLQGKGLNTVIKNNLQPGGSNDKSCAICWKEFGSLMNRKHVCRASNRYVCEDCSSKVILLHGDPRRVSDGQFNLAKFDNARRVEDMEKRAKSNQRNQVQKSDTSSTLQSSKDELFGSVGRAMKKMFVEGSEEYNKDEELTAMQSKLNQTRDAVIERGEKLSTLVEKTSALNDASVDFKNMAKQLADSQEKGFFW